MTPTKTAEQRVDPYRRAILRPSDLDHERRKGLCPIAKQSGGLPFGGHVHASARVADQVPMAHRLQECVDAHALQWLRVSEVAH